MAIMKKVLSLLEISESHNISYQTLNYYTSLGLLHSTFRKGNKRLYDAEDTMDRLKKIDKLKNAGFPLRIISGIINGKQETV